MNMSGEHSPVKAVYKIASMNKKLINEEQALNRLTYANVGNINDRYIRLNSTYNLGRKWHPERIYKKADKPIKVFHFHPKFKQQYEITKPLLPDHLLELFKKHGY